MQSNPIYKYAPGDIFSEPHLTIAEHIRANQAKQVAEVIDKNAGINLDLVGKQDITLLFWACAHRFPESVKALLLKGANPNVTMGKGKFSAHLVAVTTGGPSDDILRLLLEFDGDPNGTVSGEPAIFQAATARKIDRLKLLLEHGADINAINKKTDLSLIHHCATLQLYDWVIYLLNKGADYERKDGVGGSVALEIQKRKGQLNPDYEVARATVEKILIQRGVVFPVKYPWQN